MSTQPIWMIRAGRGSENIDDFLEEGLVKIEDGAGHGAMTSTAKSGIEESLRTANPEAKPGSIASWASQLLRFATEPSIGDEAITYDAGKRVYYLGEIISAAEERPQDGSLARRVEWRQKISRDSLRPATRNSLGSTLTLFLIQGEAAEDLRAHAITIDAELPATTLTLDTESDTDEQTLVEEMVSKASEFLEDRIAKLDWEEMQELVAEILRAMGYRARVSPKGADRGVDIIASPDGLGLQEPRIFVEVKHRTSTTISADQVRSFIGGRQSGDRCLYVSTGGFTKDARYEAERSSVPITLITLPDLRELLTEYYDRFSPAGSALIPLERLYWPVS